MTEPRPEYRRAELLASLAAVRARIADAALAAGRDPRSIRLIAVTKTFPISDVLTLLELGVADLGESRDQEAREKLTEVAGAGVGSMTAVTRGGSDLTQPRWHFIGRLQTNKCRSVARYAHTVHTVDRAAVADALSAGVLLAGRAPLPVFAQVSLDGDPDRGGVGVSQLLELAAHIAALDALQLVGVMAVAPLEVDPAAAFERLAAVSQSLREQHPAATGISAGMSHDLEQAIRFGATHVRVGSALLGRRSATFG